MTPRRFEGRGVRVNAICPDAVDTPMIPTAAKAAAAQGEAIAARRTAHSATLRALMPVPRISTPDEQAAAIAFLASDDSTYINGVASAALRGVALRNRMGGLR